MCGGLRLSECNGCNGCDIVRARIVCDRLGRVVTFLGEMWIRVTCSGLTRFGAIGSALVRFASCRETPCARSRASRSSCGPGTTDRRSPATPAGPLRSRASLHPLLALHERVQGLPPRTALSCFVWRYPPSLLPCMRRWKLVAHMSCYSMSRAALSCARARSSIALLPPMVPRLAQC